MCSEHIFVSVKTMQSFELAINFVTGAIQYGTKKMERVKCRQESTMTVIFFVQQFCETNGMLSKGIVGFLGRNPWFFSSSHYVKQSRITYILHKSPTWTSTLLPYYI